MKKYEAYLNSLERFFYDMVLENIFYLFRFNIDDIYFMSFVGMNVV